MAGEQNSEPGGEPFKFEFDPSSNGGTDFSVDAIAISPDFGGSNGGTGSGTPGNSTGGIDSGNAGTGTGKRRGRPPGSGNGRTGSATRKVSRSASLEGVSRLLQIVSVGVANVTRLPEIKLDDTDSKSLAEVYTNLAEQYGYKPDPKIEALFAAVVVTGQIAFAKYILIRLRMNLEASNKEPQADPFVDMTNVTFVNGAFASNNPQ